MNFLDPRLPDRFWNKVQPCPMSGCWLWTAGGNHGYGTFGTSTRGVEKRENAHRFSYRHLVAPIPDGLVIDHLCRVRCCVNPVHMEVVTNRTNVLRGDGLTARAARSTTCTRGHEYVAGSFRLRRNGGRLCLICARANAQAKYFSNGRARQRREYRSRWLVQAEGLRELVQAEAIARGPLTQAWFDEMAELGGEA